MSTVMMRFIVLFIWMLFSTQTIANTVEQYIEHGRTRAKEGDLEAAVIMYQKALKLEENSITARKELANILLEAQLNDHYSDQTAAEIAALQEIKPGKPYSPLYFPLYFLYNAALGAEEEALSFDALLALTQLQKGENESAIKTANTLQTKTPSHPVPHNILGLAWAAKGETKRARDSYEKALSLKKDFHAARLNLAELEIRSGNYPEAKADLEFVLKAQQNNRRASLLMAKLCELEGNATEAKRWYQNTSKNY